MKTNKQRLNREYCQFVDKKCLNNAWETLNIIRLLAKNSDNNKDNNNNNDSNINNNDDDTKVIVSDVPRTKVGKYNGKRINLRYASYSYTT